MARIYQGIYEILNKPEDFSGTKLLAKCKVPNQASDSIASQRKKEAFIKGIYSRLGLNAEVPEHKEILKQTLASRGDSLKELYELIFGEELLVEASKQNDEELREQFEQLIFDYKYFTEADFEAYNKMYEVVLHVANHVEHNNDAIEVYERAYKLMVLFGTDVEAATKAMDNFVPQYSQLQKPLHDICAFAMPLHFEGMDLEGWRQLLLSKNSGITMLQDFAFAEKMQQLNKGKAPTNGENLKALVARTSYGRASENESFARLCKHYKVSEYVFNRCLDLIKQGIIPYPNTVQDTIPDVMTDLSEVNPAYKNHYLVKLPKGDPRALILGNITYCCQHIGGNSERCVIDGVTRENQGFYVLVKMKKPIQNQSEINWDNFEKQGNVILGQGYVWRGLNDNIVFDSWENKGTENNKKIADALPVLSEKMVERDQSISRVTIGMGGKTPNELKNMEGSPEVMKEGFQYRDSRTQSEVFVSDKLTEARAEIYGRLGLDQSKIKQIVSVKHAGELKSLEDEILKYAFNNNLIIPTFDPENTALLVEENQKGNSAIYSISAIEAYKTGKVSAADLKDLDADKIELLTSPAAIALYQTGKVNAADLKAETLEGIYINILKNISLYICNDGREIETKEDISIDILKALTSWGAIEAYQTGAVSPEDLKDLDAERIKLLTSWFAIDAYQTGKVSAADLKDLDAERIKLLTSCYVIEVYKKGYGTFLDLKDLDADKIELLTSPAAITLYQTGKVSAADLKDLDADKIELLTSPAARYAYETGYVTFLDLKELDASKIKLLTSSAAIEVYEKGYVAFLDLKDLDADKIELLTSSSARYAYEKGYVTFLGLKDLDADKIELLTSPTAIALYKTGKVNAAGLKAETLEAIYINILKNISLYICKDGRKIETKEDISIDILKALTSLSAIDAYQTGAVSPVDLKDLDADKIELLTSYYVIEAYQTGKVSAADLKDLDASKIELLTSFSLRQAYKTGKVSAAELKDLDADKINLLISDSAIAAYETNRASIGSLKQLSQSQIENFFQSGLTISTWNAKNDCLNSLKITTPTVVLGATALYAATFLSAATCVLAAPVSIVLLSGGIASYSMYKSSHAEKVLESRQQKKTEIERM
ncbi:MAG: hypothetical protein ACK5WS_00715 [Alphaproteobacteria bacterium]